jgi:hypothetical protein
MGANPDPDSRFLNWDGVRRFDGLRMVWDPSISDRVQEYINSGFRVLLVIEDVNVAEPGAWPNMILQIGNEPDLTPSRALEAERPANRVFMSPDDAALWWRAWRDRDSLIDVPMYSPAFASGGGNAVDYMKRMFAAGMGRRWPDAIAIHPYAKNADEAAGEFEQMWNASLEVTNGEGRPIVATEWFRNAGEDLCPFVTMLNKPGGMSNEWSSFFCMSNLMGADFEAMGLFDDQGNLTAEGAAMFSCPCAFPDAGEDCG